MASGKVIHRKDILHEWTELGIMFSIRWIIVSDRKLVLAIRREWKWLTRSTRLCVDVSLCLSFCLFCPVTIALFRKSVIPKYPSCFNRKAINQKFEFNQQSMHNWIEVNFHWQRMKYSNLAHFWYKFRRNDRFSATFNRMASIISIDRTIDFAYDAKSERENVLAFWFQTFCSDKIYNKRSFSIEWWFQFANKFRLLLSPMT